MIFLALPDLLHVAGRVLGPEVAVRGYGLLEADLARPQATAFGKDAYPSLDAKAAALLHSLARNHALIDGDKRLALAAAIAFCGLNGRRPAPGVSPILAHIARTSPPAGPAAPGKPVSLVLVHRCGSHAGPALESASGSLSFEH